MAASLVEQLDQDVSEFSRTAEENRSLDAKLRRYVVVDTNQEPTLAFELEGMARQVRALSLSNNDGPYLALIDETEQVAEWLLAYRPSEPLGVFILSSWDFESVWKHCRRFTRIILPDGDEASFRYYDPLTFNQYAPVLSEAQRRLFFEKFDAVYAALGPHIMRTTFDQGAAKLNWKLLAGPEIEGQTAGEYSLPQLDLTGSRHSPLFAFSKQQYEFPVIFNMPLLIRDIDEYLREDFEPQMNLYPPGILRGMIEAAMTVAIEQYKLIDLEVLRQFAEMQWRVSPGFHRQTDIHRLLSHTSASPATRWDRLLSDDYNDALAEAFDINKTEDWGLPLPIPRGGDLHHG